jgi:GH15 family glucan-1,4-alpha-glucosidase
MYPAIEDHGIIGNLRTAALVSTDGSIDFFCPFRFDNPTLFASLWDDERGGFCSIRPIAKHYRRKQLYLSETDVLTTRFLAQDGIAEITDFMPVDGDQARSVILRRVGATRGRVALRFECVPAFNYAAEGHDIALISDGIQFRNGNFGTLSVQADSRLRSHAFDSVAMAGHVLGAAITRHF